MCKTTIQNRAILVVAVLALWACVPIAHPAHEPNDRQSTLDLIRYSPARLGWYAIHRGNIGVWPGNTASGIRTAVARAARLIEVDVRQSKDKSLFLFHDRRLNEKNFAGPPSWLGRSAESLNDQEVHRLCFPPNNRDCVINFAKALELIALTSSVYLIDAKNADPKMIGQIISQANSSHQLDQVIIQVPSVDKLRFIRESHREVAILARCFTLAEATQALAFNPEIIQIDESWLTKTLVETIHRGSSKVLVKTIDSDDSADHHRRLFRAGVDIILTDQIF